MSLQIGSRFYRPYIVRLAQRGVSPGAPSRVATRISARNFGLYRLESPFRRSRDVFDMMEKEMRKFERQMERFRGVGFSRAGLPEAEALPEEHVTSAADGTKSLKLEFQMKDYRPEEIELRFDRRDKTLEIHASHESAVDGHSVSRRFVKVFRLPPEVDVDAMKSSLKDGALKIEAPLTERKVNNVIDIPIEKSE